MTDQLAALDGFNVEYVPYRVELVHPKTGLPLIDEASGELAWIEVQGHNSEAGIALKKANLARQNRQRKGFREEPADLDKMRLENANALAKLVTAWHLVNVAGQKVELECNPANVRALFADENRAWMAQQVGAALLEESNFIKA
jgi:hypothetical protein